MSDEQTPHIKVTCSGRGFHNTFIYAISEELLNEAQIWSSRNGDSTGEALMAWVTEKGCQFDCSDGPAVVPEDTEGPDRGRTLSEYYRNGKLHREDGPAYIDGTTVRYYLNGVRQPAPLSTIPGVEVLRPTTKARAPDSGPRVGSGRP